MDTTSGQLPEEWKAEFLKMKPIIPAILQLVTALVIIIFGCFGEVHIATPWWAGILFILSGTSFCFLFIWPLVTLGKTLLKIICTDDLSQRGGTAGWRPVQLRLKRNIFSCDSCDKYLGISCSDHNLCSGILHPTAISTLQ
ncbi:uncharacterized protein LOC134608006 isoform X2 [Pelobates fuscus]|uniref:uncharacterized protein LOC134608006 isoform X2 n=1 Tax=Pelobates fuscus TaxID=191477 RepID=UPI002FE4952E